MKYSLTLVAFLALVAAPFGIARAQAPQGLAASALADTSFRWQRDSVAGLRVSWSQPPTASSSSFATIT